MRKVQLKVRMGIPRALTPAVSAATPRHGTPIGENGGTTSATLRTRLMSFPFLSPASEARFPPRCKERRLGAFGDRQRQIAVVVEIEQAQVGEPVEAGPGLGSEGVATKLDDLFAK